MMRHNAARRIALLLPLVLTGAPTPATGAQEDDAEAPPSGWLRYEGHPGGAGSARLTVVPSANLALGDHQGLWEGDRGDAGPVVFRTQLVVPDDAPYRFVLETDGGRATLTRRFEGQDLRVESGAWIELEYGSVDLQLTFERDPGSAARLRLLWEGGGSLPFPPEPIPSRATRLPEPDAMPLTPLADRVLLERKGCTNCHLPTSGAAPSVEARPGPHLATLGSRASHAWLTRWVLDPARLRPGADMPRLFDPADPSEVAEAEALVHFLRSHSEDPGNPEPVATEAEFLDRGRRLYHTLGCVACHGALDSPARVFGVDQLTGALPGVTPPAPFGDLANKWFAPALARFLEDPGAAYPDGRMPSMDLSTEEADAIAGYLISRWGQGEAQAVDPELGTRGRAVFVERGCVACHALAGVEESPRVAAPTNAAGGCLDPGHADTPRYQLTDAQRAQLQHALARLATDAGGPAAPLDSARRNLLDKNCLACHRMHGEGGPDPELDVYFVPLDERTDLGDEGRMPPDLSHVGWRLETAWLHEVLAGEGRARPYMATRMPNYGEGHMGDLAEQLARMEGIQPHTDRPEPEVTDRLMLTGRELMGRTALGCLACHVYGDSPPTGSPGLAITQFGERLRYEYFSTFLQNPQRYLPGSRMPDFGTAGKSSLARVLDGDMQRQIDALWAYVSLGEFMPVPEEVEVGQGLSLVVGDRPLVHRAFLEEAGSRAIAVGLPVGAHFAFDAERVQLASVWQGEFLDASGSWSGRGGSPLGGRGTPLWSAPEGPALRIEQRDGELLQAARFGGYRLDEAGHPTFLYRFGDLQVEERVELAAAPRLVITRHLRLHGARGAARVHWRAPAETARARWQSKDTVWIPLEAKADDRGSLWFSLNVPPTGDELELKMEVTP